MHKLPVCLPLLKLSAWIVYWRLSSLVTSSLYCHLLQLRLISVAALDKYTHIQLLALCVCYSFAVVRYGSSRNYANAFVHSEPNMQLTTLARFSTLSCWSWLTPFAHLILYNIRVMVIAGGKRENYQNCSVLDCVTQCSQSAATLCEQFLHVKQIGFVTLGPLRCA